MNSHRVVRIALSFLLALALRGVAIAGPQSLSRGNGDLRVMTYNVDEGTDYLEVESATTQQEFLLAVGQTITNVRATDPSGRMQAVAQQIIAAAPTLISLQEVDRWSSGPFDPVTGTCGQLTVEFDMLQELMSDLTALGGHYQVAVQAVQYNFPAVPGFIPPSKFLCVQVINYNVILARTDLGKSRFQWSNPQSGQFVNIVSLNTPIGIVPVPRVWVALDATFNGNSFRFIGTHLESFDATVQELEGGELRSGPANTSLAVVIAMDSNAQAFPLPQAATYVDFIAAGYNDTWSEVFPGAPGLTCCQAPLVNNTASQLYQRIDLILTFGDVGAQNIAILGADAASKTPGGLWPSDHAGVTAQLEIED